MTAEPAFIPSPALARAAGWAVEMHAGQVRKATGIPYVSHLFAVAAIAMEHGADEEQTIAALLHDVIEDTPATAGDVSDRFGERVADLVVACSDSEGEPKPPWRERKEAYLRHVSGMPADALVVTMADKLHNAASIRRDLRSEGLAMFARFTNARPEDQLWYFEALAVEYRRRVGDQPELLQLVDELDRVVADVSRQVETLS